jgi:uncharacterized protein (TIGR02996 family)
VSADELLAAIHADPEADEPRQVYADWLLQRGDPRGELINLQIMRYSGIGDDSEELSRERSARETELLAAHGDSWLAEAGLTPAHRELGTFFRRGFVDYVTFMPAQLPDFAKLAREPVRAIWLRKGRPDSVAALLASACVDRVANLSIWADESPTRFDVMPELAARVPLPKLRSLDLAYVDPGGVEAFIASGLPSQLDELHLRNMNWQDDALVPLVDALDRITELQIARNPAIDRSLERLARRMPQLTALRLDGMVVLPVVLARLLAGARVLAHFQTELALSDRATTEVFETLGATSAQTLRVLELREPWERDAEIAHVDVIAALRNMLARADQLAEIELDNSDLGDAGGAAFAACTSPLDSLSVRTCGLTDRAVATMLANPRLHALESLSLTDNPIGDAAAQVIASTPFTRLSYLELDGTQITAAGARALIEAPALGTLDRLYVSKHIVEVLRARFGDVVKPI